MKIRLEKIREKIKSNGLDGLLVMKPANRHYLSGFTGSSGVLLILKDTSYVITDFRYVEQASKQAPDYQIIKHGNPITDTLKELLEKHSVRNIGFEKDFVTFSQFEDLSKYLPFISLEPVEKLTEDLRMVKDDLELASIKKAVEIADYSFIEILKIIKPGLKEEEVAANLEFIMRKLGSQKPAFESIIASGHRSALPHGIASDRVIGANEFLKMDYGAVYNGYHSDMTRTVVVGQASDKHKEIYNIVLEAQLTAINGIKPGLLGKEIDKLARDIINKSGYGDNFGHGLGHGVGLVIHEGPTLSPIGDVELQPGMVVTVEPGIYLPDWGGVRIEDIVVVTETGYEILTKTTKELLEI